MAKITAARSLIRVFRAEGVDTVFTLTGGHILPLLDACAVEGIRVVDVRHEQAAAHAADAYARLTGCIGVAMVTAGPGATDAVTGVASAWHASSPVVLLVGRHPRFEELRGGLQEMDHPPLFDEVAKWTYTAMDPDRLADVGVTAARHAYAGRGGPVVIDVPWDVQAHEVGEPRPHDPARSRANRPAGADASTLSEIAGLVAAAESPVIFGGPGLRWAHPAPLEGLAVAMGAPLFLNSLARGLVPWGHPLLGNRARSWALAGADLVVALGVDWDFRTKFGAVVNPEARVVQVDADPDRVGWNRPVDVGVVADPGLVAAQLVGELGNGPASESEWVRAVHEQEAARQEAADAVSLSDESPVHPERFGREVADFFGAESIVAADGGDIVSTTAKWLQTSKPGHLLDPGPFGCLGVGAPFAVGAKAVFPETMVGIVYGDGAFGFNAMEYDTLIRHEMPVVGVIGNDGVWNNIRTLHKAMFPDRVVAADLGVRPYHAMIEGLGGHGEFVDDPAQLRPALERAAESGLPALVNVHIAEQVRPSSVYGF